MDILKYFIPQAPNEGPPFPDFLNIYWPWYHPVQPVLTASLTGTITDADTGSPVSDVSVTLGVLNTSTNPSGQYGFNNVEPGTYVLTFSKSGYDTLTL